MDEHIENNEMMTDDDKIRLSEIINGKIDIEESTPELFIVNPQTQSLIDVIDIKLKVLQADKLSNKSEEILPSHYTDDYLVIRLKEIDDKLLKFTKKTSDEPKEEKKLEEQKETAVEDLQVLEKTDENRLIKKKKETSNDKEIHEDQNVNQEN